MEQVADLLPIQGQISDLPQVQKLESNGLAIGDWQQLKPLHIIYL